MLLREILAAKGSAVLTIGPDATLREAAKTLVKHNVGALLVFAPGRHGDAGAMLGIISERDLLRVSAMEGGSLDKLLVMEVMTKQVITASPDDPVERIMGLMTSERKRHLPVVANGQLLGIVSIGDVVKAQHDQLALENRFMKDYIQS